MSVTAVLLLTCPDQRGVVAAVADFIYQHGGNIIHADQHTDQEEGVFLQRLEFELDGFAVERTDIERALRPLAERFDMHWQVRFSDHRPRVAILVSRHGHCLYDLLARWQMGELPIEPPLVISNHLDLAPAAGCFHVPYHHLPITDGARGRQEAALIELLEANQVEIVVLARYMQILGEPMIERYGHCTINIHHSFLPAFAGGRPYHQAHERGVKVIGATAHYITADLDQGPIIEQDVVRVSHRDTVTDLIHKGRDLEKVVLARALHSHLENRVLVYGNKTVVFD